jgi:hypothetical protein
MKSQFFDSRHSCDKPIICQLDCRQAELDSNRAVDKVAIKKNAGKSSSLYKVDLPAP